MTMADDMRQADPVILDSPSASAEWLERWIAVNGGWPNVEAEDARKALILATLRYRRAAMGLDPEIPMDRPWSE
jgi:hypothetical protein